MTKNHTVRLKTRDNEELTFECGEDEHLVEAAAKAGITLPSSCQEGNCGTCHGACHDGEFEHESHGPDALLKEEGAILMCRTFPRGDITVEVPLDLAHITAGPVAERTCEIVEVEDTGGGVKRLVLRILPDENGDLGPTFEPGQFMELEVPGTDVRRAYSMANAPNWEGRLEFLIRLLPGGKFSTWLDTEAKPGGSIRVRGPKGNFVLQAGSLEPRRFVAGGTGVAPMLSQLRQMAEFKESNESRLYFGVNKEEDLFCLDQIEDLKAAMTNLTVEVCVWEPNGNWSGFTGSPVDAFRRDLEEDMKKGLQPEVYLCGPPGLVDATEEAANEQGLSHDNVFCERFLPG